MSARRDRESPWPRPTPHPTPKRKRMGDAASYQSWHLATRQPAQATVNSNDCGLVGNDVISCFPRADSKVIQNQETRFVWNTKLPQFSQSDSVDVYLFHGDTDEAVTSWHNYTYLSGHLAVKPNDTWWGAKGREFVPGQNSTQTFYFVLVANGTNSLSQKPQATFTATQTDFPDSILSSQSSASLASAASASAAAESSLSALVASSSKSAATAATGGALQNGVGSSTPFPHWAIALLAVFGFLGLISFLFFSWLVIRTVRSRKRLNGLARRNSIGSQSPMMANLDPHSPSAAPGSYGHGEPQSTESGIAPLPLISTRPNIGFSDGASTASRADSAGGPFSAVDAAAMAAAFRNVMRKPDFADRAMDEGDSPDPKESDVLNRELAEEGRDIRSVSSSRGVKVETLSDAGDLLH